MRLFTGSALLYAGLIGAAVAQTTPGSNPPSTSGTLQTTQTNTMVAHFVTVKPTDTLSSKLVGKNLYNKQNDSLGEIKDLVIENGKTVTGLVVSVGGFLGMGERYVVLDPANVVLHKENDGTAKAVVDTSKDNLKNAPAFEYSKHR